MFFILFGQIIATENTRFGPPNGGLVMEIFLISGKSGLVKYIIVWPDIFTPIPGVSWSNLTYKKINWVGSTNYCRLKFVYKDSFFVVDFWMLHLIHVDMVCVCFRREHRLVYKIAQSLQSSFLRWVDIYIYIHIYYIHVTYVYIYLFIHQPFVWSVMPFCDRCNRIQGTPSWSTWDVAENRTATLTHVYIKRPMTLNHESF